MIWYTVTWEAMPGIRVAMVNRLRISLVAGELEPVQHISQHGADHKLPTSTQIRIIKLLRNALPMLALFHAMMKLSKFKKLLGR